MRLRLLLVVEDLDEPRRILRELRHDFPSPEVVAAANAQSFRDAVPGNTFNFVIVSDRLAWSTPLNVLRRLKAESPECTVLFCVESFDEAALLEALRNGLNDYVLRTPAHLARLPSLARLAISQHEQRQALAEAERRYQTLFENVPVGLYRSTPEGQLRDVNPAFIKMLGYERREDLLARNAANLYADPTDRIRWQTRMRQDGVVRDFETRLRQRGGGELWVMEHARAVFGTGGEVLCYEGSIESIAALKREREMQAQLRQAQKMEAVGRLAAGVAHDFNNLLTAIMGYSHMLEAEAGDNPTIVEGLREITSVGERAVGLTRQLLAFGRKAAQQPRVLDLNCLVSDLHKMLSRLLGEDVELSTNLSPALPGVLADPGHLEQVVVNLAVNGRDAIHALPTPGAPRQLTIATANVTLPGDAPLPPEAQPGNYVELRVSDTGCGMTEEIRQRIFEPFFTTKEHRKGTGLGLAAVYGIVKQSNGHITVASDLGQGTVFHLYFPAATAAPAALPKPATALTPQRGNETVLVVEDDDNLRALLRMIFRPSGLTLLLAATAEEALALAAEHRGPIELLIADVVLPGMNGPELAKRLWQVRPSARVLFISGYSPEAITRTGPLPAEAAFLQKPFTPSTILRLVREILDR